MAVRAAIAESSCQRIGSQLNLRPALLRNTSVHSRGRLTEAEEPLGVRACVPIGELTCECELRWGSRSSVGRVAASLRVAQLANSSGKATATSQPDEPQTS